VKSRVNKSCSFPSLIQVVPQRTVQPNGVADYAAVLAGALHRSSGINSIFLSPLPQAGASPVEDAWETTFLPRRHGELFADTLGSLSAALNAKAVLLHFSGYGYQKRGVPTWLLDGLRRWRRRGDIPLFTIFHELYAVGRLPWHSSFWLSPIQKLIARGIFDLSAKAITPIRTYQDTLSHWGRRTDHEIIRMPVFSNVGESGRGRPAVERPATAVVFGLSGTEKKIFGEYYLVIQRIVTLMGIEKIIDVGPRSSPVPGRIGRVPLISKGLLSASEISSTLKDARFGLVAYPLDFIGKSGVFAAYAAHGVVPIVLSEKLASVDDLKAKEHFIDGLRIMAGPGEDDLGSIQQSVSDWYVSHSLKVQANLIAERVTGLTVR
jgi:hypothetical protein